MLFAAAAARGSYVLSMRWVADSRLERRPWEEPLRVASWLDCRPEPG